MIKALRQCWRLTTINFTLIRHGLDQIVLNIPWFYPLRFIAYLNPWNWRSNKQRSRGQRIRLALEELGPIFVKFGQLLSTRRDLIPDDIVAELAKLQDNVPPFPSEQAKAIVEKVYRQPLTELFQDFHMQPLASASIAQVHRATLNDGQEVVVKILRPRIKRLIEQDIDLLYTIARLLEKHWPAMQRLHPVELVKEFQRSIFDELDLMREAANASQLRRNFLNSPDLYVPDIYWPYARKKVLVMEFIKGYSISDIETMRADGVDLKRLAERGVEIFFTQVFRDCFFHADMHPGNIFVSKENPLNPKYIAVDFGIIGTLDPQDQRYLAENMLAFFHRDYRRVAELHVASCWVDPNTRVNDLESAIRTVCEPIFERPLKEISFGQLLVRLFQTAKRFNMEVQPQLLLLQKTLIHIEGLGRQIYPDLDLWKTAKPVLERWLKNQVGSRAFFKNIKDHAPFWLERSPELPDLIYNFLKSNGGTPSPKPTNANLNAGYASATEYRSSLSTIVPHASAHTRQRRGLAGFLLGLGIMSLLTTGAVLLYQPEHGQLWHDYSRLLTSGLFGGMLSCALAFCLK